MNILKKGGAVMFVDEPKHIAKEFKVGNTNVKIATDYCDNKTPEDVQKILNRIAENAMQSFIAAARNKN